MDNFPRDKDELKQGRQRFHRENPPVGAGQGDKKELEALRAENARLRAAKQYTDLTNLPHPEDLAAENELEFVGLYMRVYNQYVKNSRAITAEISGNLEQDKRLDAISAMIEVPLEKWLDQAQDYLPEWFNIDLMGYPTD